MSSIIRTRMNRRRFLTSSMATVGSLAGASTLLGACNTSNTGSSGSGKVTITIMSLDGEVTPAYLKEFQKLNPDIAVTFLNFDQSRLNAMFTAGNPPDVIRGIGFDSPNNSARGLALNLDPYIAKSSVIHESDFMSIQNLWRWDGKQVGKGSIYGLAKDWSADGTLWANEALFTSANVPSLSTTTPLTYDQFLELGTRLAVKKDGKLQTYGIDPQWGLAQAFYQMIYQQNGTIFSSDLATANFTTPAATNALQWYVNYAQAHIGPSPFDPDPNGWDGPTYLAKRLGVSQVGYWFGGEINTGSADVQATSRMAPAPVMGTNRISASFAGTGLWISANSKHPDAAWRFMEYYMTGTPAHDRAKSGWGVPSFKSLLSEMPQALPYQKEAYQVLQEELKYFQTLQVSPYTTSAAVGTLLDKYLQQAVRKQLTVSQAAQELTADVNKLLQQGKQSIG